MSGTTPGATCSWRLSGPRASATPRGTEASRRPRHRAAVPGRGWPHPATRPPWSAAAFVTWSAGRRPVTGTSPPPARPEIVAARFPGSTWANAFGDGDRAGRRHGGGSITTYRSEGGYRDGAIPTRWPGEASLTDDLGRRDFTINAMAWVPDDLAAGQRAPGRPVRRQADLAARRPARGGGPGGAIRRGRAAAPARRRVSRRPWTCASTRRPRPPSVGWRPPWSGCPGSGCGTSCCRSWRRRPARAASR